MSLYRQQAVIPPPTNDGKPKRTDVIHLKSRVVASLRSPNAQAPAFDPKSLPSNDITVKKLDLSEEQSKFISNTMRDLRQAELDHRATKRMKTDHVFAADIASSSSSDCEETDLGCNFSTGIDIVDEMEHHSHIAQFVATSGGLVTVWNDAFLEVVKPTASMAQVPLTIFDLVQPQSLHKLYGMLALALDEEVIVQQETSEDDSNATSHMSIILPTKNFRLTGIQYEMTIVFMEHIVPRERSFLGWITPAPICPSSTTIAGLVTVSSDDEISPNYDLPPRNRLPRGTILRLENRVLCQLLRFEEQ
eukprot:scaffold248409_cov63-Cyclotella_meneghiniana.AAC.2